MGLLRLDRRPRRLRPGFHPLAVSLCCMLAYKSRPAIYPCFLTLLTGLFLVGTAGCDRSEKISHYRVPKDRALTASNGPDASEETPSQAADFRMLAAMIPRGEQAWFFRLLGPADLVAGQTDNFRALVKSVHFVSDAAPEWTLPEGWQQKPASGMRYATIEIAAPDAKSSTAPLDLSVTLLPRTEADLDAYTLSNLNRWRGQLGLSPVALPQLHENVTSVEIVDGTATLVDLVGHKPQDSMSRAPFAGRGIPSAAPLQDPRKEPRGPASSSSELTYDKPAGWQPAPAGGLRKAAFAIADGAESAEVTVISLDGAGGALLPNINRWRQQIELGEITQQELDAGLRKIEVAAQSGDYVELVGPKKAILGVMAAEGGRAWFFKMTGDVPLVNREKPNFEAFVRSVRFAAP